MIRTLLIVILAALLLYIVAANLAVRSVHLSPDAQAERTQTTAVLVILIAADLIALIFSSTRKPKRWHPIPPHWPHTPP